MKEALLFDQKMLPETDLLNPFALNSAGSKNNRSSTSGNCQIH